MSRKKSQIVSRVHNKECNSKHNAPKELIQINKKIEKLNFVMGSLGTSKWKPISSKRRNEIDIIGFDYQTRSFSVNMYGETFQQRFFIKVDIPKDKGLLESKCLEMGIVVKERQEDCYYYEQLKEFYKEEIMRVVENFYGRQF